MSRHAKTLSEIILHLSNLSDMIEIIRPKLHQDGAKNLLKSQEYLLEAITQLQSGEKIIKQAEFDKLKEDLQRGE